MTRSARCTTSPLQALAAFVAAALLPLAFLGQAATPALAATQADIIGTWSTGNAAVLTGPTFGRPFNNSFNYPPVAGYSFSFTEDGYFEQAQFTWNSNATHHNCIEAVVIWQHGNYTIHNNGSLTTDPSVFPGDGRIQVQNACAAVTTNIYYYQEPGLYASFSASTWRGQDMIRLAQFDGQLLPRMFLVSRDPSKYMFPTEYITNTSTGTFEIH
ncbi:uncharacterized protein JCM15063_005241 [Sporobolomyces koalae]|uniref:uncharacterized protein n=1 Tax=Sporobolomyces koalae TaxID=500713 RepID=UPI0031701B95